MTTIRPGARGNLHSTALRVLRHPERRLPESKDLARSSARPDMSYYVYIMSSKSGVLYIGAINDIERRASEPKHGLIEGFTRKYKVTRLVYVEEFERAAEMVARERQLKGWTRRKKLELIHEQNPEMVNYFRKSV